MLYVVPYVARRHDGVEVDELAEELDLSRDELLQELDVLSQVGPPDGDPGEYLLVTVEDGRVFVDLPQRLTRPLRLTPAEGCSLLLGIRTLRESGIAPFDDALASAEAKLLKAMGRDAEAARDLASGTVVAEPDKATTTLVRRLVTAARAKKTVIIDYAAASHKHSEKREVDPYGLVHHAGEWYMVGHCHKRGDTRTFRIDRIAAFDETQKTFSMPADFDLEAYRRDHLYVPSADAIPVRVKLDALATARVGDRWPVGEVTFHDDGSSEIVIDCEGLSWVTGWVLGLGKHAKILEPEAARAALIEQVRELEKSLA
jgi:proteasome accessory factor C